MDITGQIRQIGQTQQVSEKFKKRDFVLTDDSSQYPQHLSFQLTQDKCELIDGYKVGDTIKVHLNLRGREWTSPQGDVKYFNTLEAGRIEGTVVRSATEAYHDKKAAEQTASFTNPATEDDIPF